VHLFLASLSDGLAILSQLAGSQRVILDNFSERIGKLDAAGQFHQKLQTGFREVHIIQRICMGIQSAEGEIMTKTKYWN